MPVVVSTAKPPGHETLLEAPFAVIFAIEAMIYEYIQMVNLWSNVLCLYIRIESKYPLLNAPAPLDFPKNVPMLISMRNKLNTIKALIKVLGYSFAACAIIHFAEEIKWLWFLLPIPVIFLSELFESLFYSSPKAHSDQPNKRNTGCSESPS